ncbi:MAG TPA: recombinase family protein [Pyrinomonadaceae bacterium]|nr:recombinase family protein [Pyrinomonadaceae bacterium]HMP65561.1 recombinase family protein [Pyrinomonadaceae bacterium]
MTESNEAKSTGGIAPFGYRWQNGALVIDATEAPIRKLIYELFLKHCRKKTVAKLLNDLGYRTRNDALFSDTTIDRLLRDTTAKGIRVVKGKEIVVDAIVDAGMWERANNMLGSSKPAKQAAQMLAGIVFCECGGKMSVPSNLAKYVCIDCRRKIGSDDLEEIFASQLGKVETGADETDQARLSDSWQFLTPKEKRIIVEHICERITIGEREIKIEFGYLPHSFKMAVFEQQNETGNRTPNMQLPAVPEEPSLNEPLLSEAEAAKFLGISKMTLLRKRNAGNIGFFRVGIRVLYSKEKHLIPFLQSCEK